MKRAVCLILPMLFFSCYEIERNCNDYKTGDFEFTYKVDGTEKIGKFTRTENLNIDYYEDKIDTSSIRWINDCEFILKKLHPKNNSEKEAIHMKILTTSSDSYTFEYKLAVKKPNRPTRTEQGVATKIN
ncbi:hypothetical protein [Winogradskyella sp. PE311]|uniref:hypothetical protein n=1 Tax=Winogradskyella sp. PE311 TaxID=3366943 RepID=UPI003980BC4B